MGWCDLYGEIRLLEEINAKAQRRKDAKDRGSPVEIRLLSSHLTSAPSHRLAPLRPQGFDGGRRGGEDERPTARGAVWLFSRGLDVGFVQRFVPIRERGFDKKPSKRLEASIINL